MEAKEIIIGLLAGLIIGFALGFGLGMWFYWQAIVRR